MYYIVSLIILILGLKLAISRKQKVYLILWGLLSYFYGGTFVVLFFTKSHFLDDILSLETYNILGILNCLFLLSLYIANRTIRPLGDFKILRIDLRPNLFIYSSCIVYVWIAIIVFQKEPTLEGYVPSNSPFFEYAFLFFLIATFYRPKSKIADWLTIITLVVFCYRDLSLGGRISSLQAILALGLAYNKFTLTGRRILLLLSLFLVFISIGLFRSGILESVSWELILTKIFVLDTSYFAYYSSLTHIHVLSLYDWSLRTNYFIKAFLDILFGASVFENGFGFYDLNAIVRFNIRNYGGGWPSSYLFFSFGYLGVILFPWLLVVIIKRLTNQGGLVCSFLLITIIATIPRWSLYNPWLLFRTGLLLPFILITFFNTLHAIFRKTS